MVDKIDTVPTNARSDSPNPTSGGRATPDFGPLANGSITSGGDSLDDAGGQDDALAGNQYAATGDTATGSMGVDTAALGGGGVTVGGVSRSESGSVDEADTPSGGPGRRRHDRRGGDGGAGGRGAMRVGTIAADIGKGLFAGFAGTVVMTITQMADNALRKRPPSNTPAEAAAKVLGVQPTGDEEKQRFSNLVHFGYGIGWGAVRGLIGALGLRGTPALIAHFVAVYGTALMMLPALGVAPPVSEWGAAEIADDAFQHLVYATAVNAAYEKIN